MTIDSYRAHCLSKLGVTESFFGGEILVHKVANKVFALANIISFDFINVKCDPEKALQLRDKYDGVVPGWHMNKKHWNSILLNAGFTEKQIFEWIDHSYALVVAKLPKKIQETLT